MYENIEGNIKALCSIGHTFVVLIWEAKQRIQLVKLHCSVVLLVHLT
jgi:hypothetical protein